MSPALPVLTVICHQKLGIIAKHGYILLCNTFEFFRIIFFTDLQNFTDHKKYFLLLRNNICKILQICLNLLLRKFLKIVRSPNSPIQIKATQWTSIIPCSTCFGIVQNQVTSLHNDNVAAKILRIQRAILT